MEIDMQQLTDRYYALTDFLYRNMVFVLIFAAGLTITFAGVFINTYKSQLAEKRAVKNKQRDKKWLESIDKLTSFFPLGNIKTSFRNNLALTIIDDFELALVSNVLAVALAASSILLAFAMKDIGQLWYVKLLITVMCLILPYYVIALVFDLYRFRIDRQIPKMIDEFRSAFIKHRKVKPALKESSLYIDKNLGRILAKTADSAFIESSLNNLRDRFGNVWLNMFVVLLVNYKENGGELIDQLYRLNKTMTRYGNIEKKKNKRLIWYEIFAVSASVFSIPAIFWMNSMLLGSSTGAFIDAQSNIIISRIIGFSILSLLVIRVLRKV